MDDRQAQVREGAGLEESRINTEFIGFLNRWASPVIMVLAIAALVWAGLRWMDQRRLERVDQAFAELQNATSGGNPSPASLLALADEYADVRSVGHIAKLTAIDLYIDAFIRGVQPGAEIGLDGSPLDETDLLDDDQKQVYLDQAAQLSQEIIDATSEDQGAALITINAMFRLASIHECERDFDAARSVYNDAKSRAESAEFPSFAAMAQDHIDQIDRFDPSFSLPSADELATLPDEIAPNMNDQPAFSPELLEQLQQQLRESGIETGDDAMQLPEIPQGLMPTQGSDRPESDPESDEP